MPRVRIVPLDALQFTVFPNDWGGPTESVKKFVALYSITARITFKSNIGVHIYVTSPELKDKVLASTAVTLPRENATSCISASLTSGSLIDLSPNKSFNVSFAFDANPLSDTEAVVTCQDEESNDILSSPSTLIVPMRNWTMDWDINVKFSRFNSAKCNITIREATSGATPLIFGNFLVSNKSTVAYCTHGYKIQDDDGSSLRCSPCGKNETCLFGNSFKNDPALWSLLLLLPPSSCPLGFICPERDEMPLKCPLGMYSLGGASACMTCAAGFACPYGFEAPVQCANHSFPYSQISPGSTSCTTCPAGFECTPPNSKSPCSDDLSLIGSGICSNSSKYLMSIGEAGPPILCSAGRFPFHNETSTDEYSIGCAHCRSGVYCNTTSIAMNAISKNATSCPAGTTSADMDANCHTCEPGFECSITERRTHLLQCSLGTYQSGTLADGLICNNCPSGHQCLEPRFLPQPCPPGYGGRTSGLGCIPVKPGILASTEGAVYRSIVLLDSSVNVYSPNSQRTEFVQCVA
ncbi:hypothetical protein IE077_003203, partial [Cardiosporidium cionae]